MEEAIGRRTLAQKASTFVLLIPDEKEVLMAGGSDHADMFDAPLVSVVVLNYNYAQYVEAAVASVFAQSYRNIECLVIDDMSTDGSRDVIERLEAKHDDLTVVYRARNGGQSAAVLDGLAKSKGDFLVLLDADDVLDAEAVRHHIQAHLSLRVPVGFTAVDIIQIKDNTLITVGSPSLAAFFDAEAGNSAALTRGIEMPFSKGETTNADFRALLCYVPPGRSDGWHWSPTSANCFRRDALMLVCGNPRFVQLRSCTDCYLLHGISAITGSALINKPLMYYRLHGRNVFSRTVSLNRIRTYDQDVHKRQSKEAMSILIDHLFDEAQSFVQMLDTEDFFIDIADTIDKVCPGLVIDGLSYVTRKIVLSWSMLAGLLGEERLRYWLIRKCNVSSSHPVWMNNQVGRMIFHQMFLPKLKRRVDATGERPIASQSSLA